MTSESNTPQDPLDEVFVNDRSVGFWRRALDKLRACGRREAPGHPKLQDNARLFAAALLVAVLGIAAADIRAKAADAYPSRPIQVIVPFAGGSASDVVARILLNRMSQELGSNFVVENRPGAGGNTGTAAATRATPDGYTLVMSTSGPLAANRTLFKDLGYDPEKELTPISLFATLPNIIVVNSKLPPNTL